MNEATAFNEAVNRPRLRALKGQGKRRQRSYNALIIYTITDVVEVIKQEARRRGVSYSKLAGAILREVIEEGRIEELIGEEFPVTSGER